MGGLASDRLECVSSGRKALWPWEASLPGVDGAPADYFTIVLQNDAGTSIETVQSFADIEASDIVERYVTEKSVLSPKTPSEIGNIVMSILERYRQPSRTQVQQPLPVRDKFLLLIQDHVEREQPISMVLPAFPFKSPNRTFKVLGHLPDKGEEIALMHLNSLCKEIRKVYSKGARVDIVSDGLMYNDILGISDKEVWTYGQALRELAVKKGCNHIHFVRLVELLGDVDTGEPLTEEQYLRDAPWFRSQLYQRNIPEDFSPSRHILSDHDTTLTYRGYIKFLEKDIDDKRFEDSTMSKRQIKKHREEVAKKMIARGRAFAIAIAKRFEKSIRLSIHPSLDATKLSISLIPQEGGTAMTPWHSSLVRSVDGAVQLSHVGAVSRQTHELIYENGRPSYYREKSDLFDWNGADVEFDFLYPSGMLISVQNTTLDTSLKDFYLQKVLTLAQKCSPVIVRGSSVSRESEVSKASRPEPNGDSSEESMDILAALDKKDSPEPKDGDVKTVQSSAKAMEGLRAGWKRRDCWAHSCVIA
ncbi:hypothetical protein PRK78_001136 [Emydomyces testavorans]|uniref:Pyoverdine/dityrosine biosynthesis protein n=1 Tax=Emydomyces testavorans TaxID=2070801 RepID=A0AAF0DCE4_9EURO|nr:hypothetical protein PRK78_001136 [Emydomyces testavorans]